MYINNIYNLLQTDFYFTQFWGCPSGFTGFSANFVTLYHALSCDVYRSALSLPYMNLAELPAKESPQRLHKDTTTLRGLHVESRETLWGRVKSSLAKKLAMYPKLWGSLILCCDYYMIIFGLAIWAKHCWVGQAKPGFPHFADVGAVCFNGGHNYSDPKFLHGAPSRTLFLTFWSFLIVFLTIDSWEITCTCKIG